MERLNNNGGTTLLQEEEELLRERQVVASLYRYSDLTLLVRLEQVYAG